MDIQGQADIAEQAQGVLEQDEKIMDVFDKWDEDGSGFLSKGELRNQLKQCMWALGADVTDDDVTKMVDNLEGFDVDGDGQISKEEFVTLAKEMNSKVDSEELMRQKEEAVDCIIAKYDANNDGSISEDELKTFLSQYGTDPLSQEECDECVAEIKAGADVDGDGRISTAELKAYFCRMAAGED